MGPPISKDQSEAQFASIWNNALGSLPSLCRPLLTDLYAFTQPSMLKNLGADQTTPIFLGQDRRKLCSSRLIGMVSPPFHFLFGA